MSDKKKPFDAKEIQEVIKIITDATLGVTNITEEMQNKILEPVPLVKKVVGGISSVSYAGIRSLTKIIGSGISMTVNEVTIKKDAERAASASKIKALSALNGAVGNYLADSENDLAIPMQFKHDGKELELESKALKKAYKKITGKLLVLVHGLCMSDLQWEEHEVAYGSLLEKELNYTPVYLHYNSGLHISKNGQEFSQLLEALITNWPTAVEEIHLVGHSMGGLLCRSALYYGEKAQQNWRKQVTSLVCLGSPHHGAPLEQLGSYVDTLLEAIAYAKPFAKLGKIRSEGITDLRNGNIIDEDWIGRDRFERTAAMRTPVPLPLEMNCYSIAAVLGEREEGLAADILGDGLVPLDSALGKHAQSDFQLKFKKEHTHIIHQCGHFDLLNDERVYEQLKEWLRN